MITKISVIALLALVIIPASVFAAGSQFGGAGTGTPQAGGQESRDTGQYSSSNQTGSGVSAEQGNRTLTRDRTCEQVQAQLMTQLQTKTQARLKDQLRSQNQCVAQAGSGTGDQLRVQNQTRLREELCIKTCEKLRSMTRIQSRINQTPG
jgi:hypothetical protein